MPGQCRASAVPVPVPAVQAVVDVMLLDRAAVLVLDLLQVGHACSMQGMDGWMRRSIARAPRTPRRAVRYLMSCHGIHTQHVPLAVLSVGTSGGGGGGGGTADPIPTNVCAIYIDSKRAGRQMDQTRRTPPRTHAAHRTRTANPAATLARSDVRAGAAGACPAAVRRASRTCCTTSPFLSPLPRAACAPARILQQ
jgi:hypothetical protein